MTAFATARTWTVATALIAAFAAAHAQQLPVTASQRSAAQQVAQQGVPVGELAPDAPDSYTVKRGDTLWGISGMYLRRPWRWPELWGMNMQAIANPHLIYPGQVLYLDKRDGYARLSTARPMGDGGEPGVVRVSPSTRSESLAQAALPTLQPHLIEPFLAEPLVVDAEMLLRAPRLIATTDERVLMASGDRAYARGTAEAPLRKGDGLPRQYRVFRDAVALKDPISGEVLGYEAKYLGLADLIEGETSLEIVDGKGEKHEQASPATVDLSRAKTEMRAGDRLLPAPERTYMNYAPHAPQSAVKAHVVSLYGDQAVRWAANNQVIAINKGTQDGMDVGTVLELTRRGVRIVDKTGDKKEEVQLPDERNGHAMVFRTFDRVSYALILEARRGVEVGDSLTSPAP
ncbi:MULTISPECIES: LysM peptidoglycan-binding domain-containing protein [Delftia]|uniref:LysM peptidoglycan-binding domain-containing protein n=2 Tax=Delftia TaxID=80865 RepID=A0A7T2RZV8_DELAC|nr:MULTISPECIES: LysM domain-containing protein [Delftia]MBB1652632.1 peptidoglycan-binding protein [Delftia sp. UME58]QPS06363.1 LysM peptidoglycan-binding domain-containing protein [Delftia acidovorans]